MAQHKIYFCAWSALSLLAALALKLDRFATMQYYSKVEKHIVRAFSDIGMNGKATARVKRL